MDLPQKSNGDRQPLGITRPTAEFPVIAAKFVSFRCLSPALLRGDIDKSGDSEAIFPRMVTDRFATLRAPALALGACIIALTLAACGPANDVRGNNPNKKALAEIKPGVTDKASVTQLLGSPSTVATFDPNTWYYVSQETQNVAFFKPKLKDEKVVSISFDKQGVVKKVAFLSMTDHRDVHPIPTRRRLRDVNSPSWNSLSAISAASAPLSVAAIPAGRAPTSGPGM